MPARRAAAAMLTPSPRRAPRISRPAAWSWRRASSAPRSPGRCRVVMPPASRDVLVCGLRRPSADFVRGLPGPVPAPPAGTARRHRPPASSAAWRYGSVTRRFSRTMLRSFRPGCRRRNGSRTRRTKRLGAEPFGRSAADAACQRGRPTGEDPRPPARAPGGTGSPRYPAPARTTSGMPVGSPASTHSASDSRLNSWSTTIAEPPMTPARLPSDDRWTRRSRLASGSARP